MQSTFRILETNTIYNGIDVEIDVFYVYTNEFIKNCIHILWMRYLNWVEILINEIKIGLLSSVHLNIMQCKMNSEYDTTSTPQLASTVQQIVQYFFQPINLHFYRFIQQDDNNNNNNSRTEWIHEEAALNTSFFIFI